MIKSLEIQNIALISKLSLNFSGNLTVLSGETGSGKSIIIDSLAFVLGERADKTMIKHGEQKAYVEVVFEVSNQNTMEILQQLGFEADTTIVISRTLTMEGKNECRVNGRVCSTSMLKQISSTLVDIFGQSQHQYLLKVDNHLSVIDGFCQFDDLKTKLRELYLQHRSIVKQLQQFGGNAAERERMLDILKFQIDEITNAELSEQEEIDLEMHHKRFVNIEKIASALSSVQKFLCGDEPHAVGLLVKARNDLSNIENFDDEISKLHKRLSTVVIETDDIASSIQQLVGEIDYNPAQIDAMEARIEKIKSLKRKYGGTIANTLQFLENAKTQYENLFNATEIIQQLLYEKSKIVEEMYKISHKISAIRKKTAEIFSKDIENQLADLGMKGTTFCVAFGDVPDIESYENNITANGYDKPEFLFSANVGEPVKPLAKVISGGEMSRFMLAVKNVTATVENIPTMVFDEIDIGISGQIAKMVAIKLMKVSKAYQCIVITHLPQVAAMADCNLYISKSEKVGRTQTDVCYLSTIEQKTNEVARLMGGIGEYSKANALEVIKWCEQQKHAN